MTCKLLARLATERIRVTPGALVMKQGTWAPMMGRGLGTEPAEIAGRLQLSLRYTNSVGETDRRENNRDFYSFDGDFHTLRKFVAWLRARCRLYGGAWVPPRLLQGKGLSLKFADFEIEHNPERVSTIEDIYQESFTALGERLWAG